MHSNWSLSKCDQAAQETENTESYRCKSDFSHTNVTSIIFFLNPSIHPNDVKLEDMMVSSEGESFYYHELSTEKEVASELIDEKNKSECNLLESTYERRPSASNRVRVIV